MISLSNSSARLEKDWAKVRVKGSLDLRGLNLEEKGEVVKILASSSLEAIIK
jgi:hypothetical protein